MSDRVSDETAQGWAEVHPEGVGVWVNDLVLVALAREVVDARARIAALCADATLAGAERQRVIAEEAKVLARIDEQDRLLASLEESRAQWRRDYFRESHHGDAQDTERETIDGDA